MNIGFFVFSSQEEFEKKQAMLDKAKCTEKMYSGDNENAFSEFALTVLNSGDTVYLPSSGSFFLMVFKMKCFSERQRKQRQRL